VILATNLLHKFSNQWLTLLKNALTSNLIRILCVVCIKLSLIYYWQTYKSVFY